MRHYSLLALAWLLSAQAAVLAADDGDASWIDLSELPAHYFTESNEPLYVWTPGVSDHDVVVCQVFDASVTPWEPIKGMAMVMQSYRGGFRLLNGEDLRTLTPGAYGLKFWVVNKDHKAEVKLNVLGPLQLPEDVARVDEPEADEPEADTPEADEPVADEPADVGEPPAIPFSPDDFDLVVGAGMVEYKPQPDSQVIYVPSRGSIKAAYDKLRDGYPDFIVLQAGGVYDLHGSINWTKSGRSAAQPMVFTVQGEGARPRIRCKGGFLVASGGEIKHVVFDGLHATAARRDPDDPDFNGGAEYENGISISTAAQGLVFQDVELSYFTFNMLFQDWKDPGGALRIRDVILRRCIIRDSYALGGNHSTGLFAVEVNNMLIEDTIFDHNGWNERVKGSLRIGFNHNVYQTNCQNVVWQNNIFARDSYIGLKIRSDTKRGNTRNITIKDNLFLDAAMAVTIGDNDAGGPPSAHNITMTGNVSLRLGAEFGGATYAKGMTVMKIDGLRVESNIFTDKGVPDASKYVQPAITFNGGTDIRNVLVKGNVVRWPAIGYFSGKEIDLIQKAGGVTHQGNLVNVSDGYFQDADRGFANYDKSIGGNGSPAGFLFKAVKQPRGAVDERYTAAAVIEYIRKGFAGK